MYVVTIFSVLYVGESCLDILSSSSLILASRALIVLIVSSKVGMFREMNKKSGNQNDCRFKFI